MAIPRLIRYSDNSYVTSEGTLFEGFETFADWTKVEGDSIEADSMNVREGLLGLKLNSVNGAETTAQKTINKNFSAVTNFIVWVYVHNLSTLYRCSIYFSSVTDWSKYFSVTLNGDRFKAGWNRMVMAKNQFAASGGELWSNTMIRMRVRCDSTASNDTSISVDDLCYDYNARPKVIIAFDDGHESVYNKAKSIMDGNSQDGIAFIISSKIGTAGYMTLANLTSLQSADWDISNHTKTHLSIDALSGGALDDEVNDAYDWLVENGFGSSAKFFSYPNGDYDDEAIAKVKEHHMIARCSIGGDFQSHFNLNDNDIDALVKMRMVYNSSSTATVQGWIDTAITQGGLLILLFHQIVDSGASENTQYLTADFQTISNYLKTKSDADDLDVITFSDYYDQFILSNDMVYLQNAAIVPYPIAYKPKESVDRGEDGRMKVYKHPSMGDRKRLWRIKCIVDDSEVFPYKWRDLEYFYVKVVEGALRQCVFVDANSVQHLVRIVDFLPRAIGGKKNRHEVTMILEEDYI